MNQKSFIFVIIILIVVGIMSLASYLPTRTDAALKVKVENFPKEIGEWKGVDIPVSEQDYAILETRNLFVRNYKDKKDESVYLYVIYSEDNRKVSHPPEICLLGSGMTIVNKSTVRISNLVKAIKLIVEKKYVQEMVVYWFKAGNLYTENYLKQQLKIVTDRMLRKRTSGALIRISTVMKENEREETSLELIKRFAAQIQPLLPEYVP
ncbi:MAG: exosortase C-terminal domain/associated protein EpsI [Candidatus Omnitrophota bacterium]